MSLHIKAKIIAVDNEWNFGSRDIDLKTKRIPTPRNRMSAVQCSCHSRYKKNQRTMVSLEKPEV